MLEKRITTKLLIVQLLFSYSWPNVIIASTLLVFLNQKISKRKFPNTLLRTMSKVDAEPLNKMKVIEREVPLDDIRKNLLVQLKTPLSC